MIGDDIDHSDGDKDDMMVRTMSMTMKKKRKVANLYHGNSTESG